MASDIDIHSNLGFPFMPFGSLASEDIEMI
jgi:hypothetical protein